jgi:hypothetical protein
MKTKLLLTLPLLLIGPAIGQTTQNSKAKLDQYAKLPDWSGVWKLKGSPALLGVEDGKSFVPGVRDYPPYNAEWEAKYKENLIRAEHQGDAKYPNPLVDTHTLYCAAGVPHLMVAPFDYEFIVTPEKTWMVIDKETRHIYTDGRKFLPEDEMWPTLRGTSTGHWEGQTLVIETIMVKSGIWGDFTPVIFSDKAKYVERIHQVDENTLENQMTITDPVSMTKPWSVTKHYVRLKKGTWVQDPETCGGPDDRNPIIDGHLTVQLPGDKK